MPLLVDNDSVCYSLVSSFISYRFAFGRNLALTSPGEDSFRPISRSLSSRDKKADYCTRLRSGSDAKLR